MSIDTTKPTPHRNDEFQSVQLGDLLGNDPQLNSALELMSRELRADSDGTSNYFLYDLLAWFKSLPHGLTAVAKKSASFVCEATKRFYQYEITKTLAIAKADQTRTIADAEAEYIRAQADKIRADSMQILNAANVTLIQGLAVAERTAAETAEVRAATKRRDELLKLMKKNGIEWLSEVQGDMLNVAVTKNTNGKLIE